MSQGSQPYKICLGESEAKPLQPQLDSIPRDAEWLRIENEVPTDKEWEILGSHFTSVRNLEVEAGWNEYLNDGQMPENWPLQRLLMSSSCGEVTENPHILLGKVQHLIMLLTMSIRFEGPTSYELTEAHEEAVMQGDKNDHGVTDSGVKITYRPALVREWMVSKYNGKDIEVSADAPATNPDIHVDTDSQVAAGTSGSYNLTKLELLDNDAMEAFIRFTVALPKLAFNLQTLNIRSTNCCDLNDSPDDMFLGLFSNLDRLQTLVLTLGEVFGEDDTLYMMCEAFPENIRTLRFRGPISLTQHSRWEGWVSRFADPSFLPNLECLSFVCDMAYDRPTEGYWRRVKRDATEDELRQSKERCEGLLSAFRSRQQQNPEKVLTVEPFIEEWTAQVAHLDGVNPLWESI